MQENRKLTSIMCTGIDGFSALITKNELKAHEMLQKSRAILKHLLRQFKGELLKEMGDSALVRFSRVELAVKCALMMQRSLRDDTELSLRIGIHIGDVVFAEGDVFGDGIDIASQIMNYLEPGGICVSERVYFGIKNNPDIDAVFIAEKRVKNVSRPIKVYAIKSEGLPEPGMRSVSGAEVSKSLPSVAVLPFIDMSPEKDQEYFCEGMAEEIINALTHVEGLNVIARTSSFQFPGKGYDIHEIGEKLKVQTVLEGSVRKAGNTLRITAQLINVENGYHIWSQKFDRVLEDVFSIQDEISFAIVEALKVKLMKKEKAAIERRHTEDTEAYNLYLKGRYFWNKRTEEGLKKCVAFCKSALDLNADYAPAYAGLADALFLLGFQGVESQSEAFPKAKTAALEALHLDQSLADAHISLGCIYAAYDHNWQKSKEHFRYALQLNPNLPMVHYWYAIWYLLPHRQYDSCLTEIKEALNLDPLSLVINTGIGWQLYFAHKYDEAIPVLKKVLELDPYFIFARDILGQVYTQLGMFAMAEKELKKAVELSYRRALSLSALGHTYTQAGKHAQAEKIVAELETLSQKKFVSGYDIALIYAGMNRKEQAIYWLEQAYNDKNGWLVFLNVEPRWESMKSYDRFNQLIERIGLLPASQSV